LVQREIGFHRREPERDIPDLAFERPDPRGEVRDLVPKPLLFLLLRGELSLQRGDLRIDLLFLRRVVAERRRSDHEHNEKRER
jgi:hypothetical protein